MSYRLKLLEPMDRAFRRIATEQVERAIGHLAAAPADAVTAVHATRKCLKRTRALLRFFRPALERATFKNLNGELRDMGRTLAGTRDLDVLQQTVAALRGLKAPTVTRLDRILALERRAKSLNRTGPERWAELSGELHAMSDRLASVPLDDAQAAETGLLTTGLGCSLDTCRQTFDAAFATEDDDALHEWRKAVQVHWRHMQLVASAWPAYCAARIEEARSISFLAGEARDLGMLLAFAKVQPLPKMALVDVEAKITRQLPGLRNEARLRGARLLAEGTRGHCTRLETHWITARSLRETEIAIAS